MSDYGYDSDEFDLYDDGWLYIAEEDHLADDLAERAIASPPLRDYDLDGSGYNSDYFEYWVDIEYNSDGWNDDPTKKKTTTTDKPKSETTPKKRKKVAQAGPSRTKKRKGARGRQLADDKEADDDDTMPTVLWQSHKEREQQLSQSTRLLTEEPKESFALLRDWRTRFGTTAAAAAGRREEKGKGKKAAVDAVEDGSDAWEDVPGKDTETDGEAAVSVQEDEGEGGGGLDSLITGSGLDPQALMRAVQENLAASGAVPAGLDQSKLLEYALRMFGGEEAGEIAGALADDLFEQIDGEEPDTKDITDWTAKQKGQLENGEEKQADAEHDEASEPESKPATHVDHGDAAAGTEKKGKKKGAAQPAQAPASAAAGTRSRKRKAADPAPDDEPPPTRPKRATRSYAAPTATSKAKSAGRGGKGKRG